MMKISLLKRCLNLCRNLNPYYWREIFTLDKKKSDFSVLDKVDREGTAIVWFSYTGDFSLLEASINSVNRFAIEKISNLVIVEDCSGKFTEEQKNILVSKSKIPLTFYLSPKPMGWAGIGTISTELQMFHKIFADLKITWLVKLDSDALIISDDLFLKLECIKEQPTMLGQSARKLYTNNLTTKKIDWAQGGAYCINYSALNSLQYSSIISAVSLTLKVTNLPLKYIPEDVFFTQLFKRAGVVVELTEFHYPIWFRGDLYPPNMQSNYSVLHFEGCKGKQVEILNEIIGLEAPYVRDFLDSKWELLV